MNPRPNLPTYEAPDGTTIIDDVSPAGLVMDSLLTLEDDGPPPPGGGTYGTNTVEPEAPFRLFFRGLACPGGANHPCGQGWPFLYGLQDTNGVDRYRWLFWTNWIEMNFGEVVSVAYLNACTNHTPIWPIGEFQLIATEENPRLTNYITWLMPTGYNASLTQVGHVPTKQGVIKFDSTNQVNSSVFWQVFTNPFCLVMTNNSINTNYNPNWNPPWAKLPEKPPFLPFNTFTNGPTFLQWLRALLSRETTELSRITKIGDNGTENRLIGSTIPFAAIGGGGTNPTWTILSSTNLASTNWTVLATGIAPDNCGLFSYCWTNWSSNMPPMQFYRLALEPLE